MKRLFSILINKYVITSIVFILTMLFFNQNDWFTQRERQRNLDNTKDNIASVKKQIADMKQQLYLLNNDPATIEQYAREQYLEKKPSEDLYIIVRDSSSQENTKK